MTNFSRKYVVIALITVAILAVAGIIYSVAFQPPSTVNTTTAQTEEAVAPEQEAAAPDTYDEATAPDWVKKALEDRVMGSEDAPITMIDNSSLTCPHCADFHLNTLPQIKKDYIDTGKVKLVFGDFPLNLPALQASALARCVEGTDAYFAFIEQLFRTQEQWGASENARNDLLNATKFSGLSREDAARCLDDKQLTAGLLQKIDKTRTDYSINSTPTFVLIKDGHTEKVEGALPYKDFKAALDKML